MVEDHRAVDHEEVDRRRRELLALGERMPVEEHRSLVGEQSHETSGERGQVREVRGAERVVDGAQRVGRTTRERRREPEVPDDVLDPGPVGVDRDDRCGVARHEGVPAPPLGALHALEQHARPVFREGREHPDRRGDVGGELGPDRDERPLARERVELVSVRPDPQALHVSPSSTGVSRLRRWLGNAKAPGAPGAVGARWLLWSAADARRRRAVEPPAPTRVRVRHRRPIVGANGHRVNRLPDTQAQHDENR